MGGYYRDRGGPEGRVLMGGYYRERGGPEGRVLMGYYRDRGGPESRGLMASKDLGDHAVIAGVLSDSKHRSIDSSLKKIKSI